MFNFFKSIFMKKVAATPQESTLSSIKKSKIGEDLLSDEQKALEEGRCPDCSSTDFFEGPCGGMSVNIKCAHCGSKFNVVPGWSIPYQRI
jgi:DNA-directed RNA polymerase subunit RPC12/RpoP